MQNNQKPQGSLFFPLLLISAGILVFLVNFDMITGSVWDNCLLYWPVLLIICGLDGFYKRSGWIGPSVCIGLGSIFLLGNLNYFTIDSLSMLLRFWPVLLVAIGLDILFGNQKSGWGNLFRVLFGLLLVAGIIWAAVFSPSFGYGIKTIPYSQTLDQARQADLVFTLPAGGISISGNAEKNMLVSGKASLPRETDFNPEYSAPQNGKSALVLGMEHAVIPFTTVQTPWDFKITSKIPVDLQVKLGVGRITADLSDTHAVSVVSEMGVGSATITLPANEEVNAKISGGIGALVIRVPKGSQVSIETDGAIVDTNLPEGYLKNDDRISSGVSKPGASSIQIEVDLGIGSIEIQEVD